MKIDKKEDRKILHELDFNSRRPVSAIAKKLGLSRDIVNYRMKKFIEEKLLLKYHAIIDISKLGYAAHKNFIRFQNLTEEKEQQFLEYIRQNPNVVFSASYDGKYDVAVSIWARNVEELSENARQLEKHLGDYIAERQLATIVRGEYCVRDYLVGKKTYTKRQYFFGSTPKPVKIDDINKRILLELGKDARVSSVDVADKLKLSADAIYQRIRKLEQAGVIQNYNIVPNEENYPFFRYKILVSLHNLTAEKLLLAYCREQQNIWYFCTTLGQWDIEIDLEVENQTQFRKILREFKLQFSDIVKDYTVLTAYRTNKYNFCPSIPK